MSTNPAAADDADLLRRLDGWLSWGRLAPITSDYAGALAPVPGGGGLNEIAIELEEAP